MFQVVKVLISGGIILSLLAQAEAQQRTEPADTDTTVKAKAMEKDLGTVASNNPTLNSLTGGGSGWTLQGSLTHIPKARKDQEDTTDILLRADYSINKKHQVRLQQFFTKFYGKYRSEYEFKPTDTTLAHFFRPDWKPLGINLQWRNQFSLPVSNESNRDNLITRLQTQVVATKGFFGNRLMTFAVPYARYHVYEYKTSVSGTPLPMFTLGASVACLYFITPKLSFYAGLNYNFENTTESQFEPDPQYRFDEGIYRFDLDLSYQALNSLTTSVSYFQGANYLTDGRYELVFYDNQESRLSVGLTYIY